MASSTGLQRVGGSFDGTNQTLSNKGSGVGVAIIDTGINQHSDLSNVRRPGATCDPHIVGTGPNPTPTTDQSQFDMPQAVGRGHGTGVAGILAATGSSLVAGAAPGVSVYPVKVYADDGTPANDISIMCGLDWATQHASQLGIDIINLSAGFAKSGALVPRSLPSSCPNSYNGVNDNIHAAVCRAYQAGIPVVTGAGNDGQDIVQRNFVPAAYGGSITAAAYSDFDGRPDAAAQTPPSDCSRNSPGQLDDYWWRSSAVANGSNWGARVDIVAPGVCIRTTGLFDDLNTDNAFTSFAAPLVTGAAALYIENYRALYGQAPLPEEVRQYLIRSQETGPIPGNPGTPQGVGSQGLLRLRQFGRVPITWGDNQVFPSVVQGAPTGVIGLAALRHTLAVRHDGSVWSWGNNQYGQAGQGDLGFFVAPGSVSGLGNAQAAGTITAVAAGNKHSLALSSDGKVWAWGYNTEGQLGDPNAGSPSGPVLVLNAPGEQSPYDGTYLNGIIAISAGDSFNMALRNDGKVFTWSYNDSLQLGTSADDTCGIEGCNKRPKPVPGLTSIQSVAAGGYHALAAGVNGTVYVWGGDDYGQLGDGGHASRWAPWALSLTGVRAVAAGNEYSLALLSDGNVKGWGGNFEGQLGVGPEGQELCLPLEGQKTCSRTPIDVPVGRGVVALSAGFQHVLALDLDGNVVRLGRQRKQAAWLRQHQYLELFSASNRLTMHRRLLAH
ncbi:MAG TPA: S8 family serine peptidase [Chloroflexota bacterium]